MPVYKETLDEPVGVVHVKDVFKLLARKTRRPKPTDQMLSPRHNLLRPMIFVPGAMRASELLAQMRADQTHMALVIDEFGGVDGLVTLEDLLETLVGEIADEHDTAEEVEEGSIEVTVPGGDRTWLVDGMLRADELEEQTGFRLPEGPYETVAGFIMARLGHIPEVGESLIYGDWELTVVEMDRHRIEQVRLVEVNGGEQ